MNRAIVATVLTVCVLLTLAVPAAYAWNGPRPAHLAVP
jgi:hypothetical protein